MFKRLGLTAVALLAVAACSDQLPKGVTYKLATANNNPLPILLKQDSCLHYLHGGTVQLDGKGGFHSTYDIRKVCGDKTSAAGDPGTQGTFKLRHDTTYFYAAGKPAGFGVITADSLVVRSPIHRLVYIRNR